MFLRSADRMPADCIKMTQILGTSISQKQTWPAVVFVRVCVANICIGSHTQGMGLKLPKGSGFLIYAKTTCNDSSHALRGDGAF